MSAQKRDFDKAAATWDEDPRRVKLAEQLADAIRREVDLTSTMDVLDFGCGTGLVTLPLAALVRSVTGADGSRGMLDVLRQKAARLGLTNVATIHLEAGADIPGCYDMVISTMTLHHVENVDRLLGAMFRALRSPGRIALADLDPDGGLFHSNSDGVFHEGFDRADLRERLVQAGFREVRDMTAAEVTRPAKDGSMRSFSVFLMVGTKTPQERRAPPGGDGRP